MTQIRIGCSGWEYAHWRGNFYAADLPRTGWLEHYATIFDTVEINNSFYRLPSPATMAAWRDRVPRRFLFAVKASRFLTHMKKLKDPEEPIARLFASARQLRSTLGPVLYQLPPRWTYNLERLEHFLDALPRRVRHVVEFRDPSWYRDETFAALERRRVAWCLHDHPHAPTGRDRVVGPFVYIRFHGADGTYTGSYSNERLARWAEWIALRAAERDVFAYFNNDVGGHAPRNAVTLKRLALTTRTLAPPTG
jgi:uncharacterized protein YecE (DUF72 family)